MMSKYNCQRRLVAEMLMEVGRLLVVSSIVGFGSRTSSNQVIMQCYCFLFTAGGSGVPQCCIIVFCVGL